jgi:hypothetical protein
VFESVTTALARLIARLRAASRGVHAGEVTRALGEDEASHTGATSSERDDAAVAQRARAAAEAARRSRGERK